MNQDIFITDLPSRVIGGFKPARGVGEGWIPVEFETAANKGTGLAAGCRSGAEELTLRLDLKGMHTLHLALGTYSALTAWLDGDGQREFIAGHGGGALQECCLHASDLTGKSLHIALREGFRTREAFIGYIRAVPCAIPHRSARNMIASNDGWSWIAMDGVNSENDVSRYFTALRDSDYFRMLWCPGGADFSSCHRTKVGTIAPVTPLHANRNDDRNHIASFSKFIAGGGDILKAAVENARAIGMEIHFYIRVEAFRGGFPWEHMFTSKFFTDHPEWRCRDEFGDEIMRMSYAFPQVQDHMIEYMEELLQYKPDGLCLAFTRSMPMLICEEPVLAEFERRQGRRPKLPEEVDSPGMIEARTTILTGYLEKVHAMLKRRNLPLSCIANGDLESARVWGLDMAALVERGMFESICVLNGGVHVAESQCHKSSAWKKLRDSGKTKIYPYAWGGSYDHKETAKYLKECILDSGFTGGFLWDTETNAENPYNWHVLRKGGTREFVEGVLQGSTPSPVIHRYTRIQGMKLGRYNPMGSF